MALDKVFFHNIISPNASLEVVGFGRDNLGHFRIVLLQPYIQGDELTDSEFETFKQKQNLKEENGFYNFGYFRATDIAPYNIKKHNNEYFIIDADFRLNKDDFAIDNSIIDIEEKPSKVNLSN